MFRALLLVLALLTLPAATVVVEHARGPSYTGPGDIVSGATAFYGLRAYNAAYAATPGKSVNVRRASDNVACDVNVATTGGLGLTTATCNSSTQGGITPSAFAGTDATAQGSTTGLSTTIAFTSASSTPHAFSTLTGAGLTQPAYIVSCGTFTLGAGTCTLNQAQNISVTETITMTYGLFVTEAYDQTGNGNNLIQATAGNQPQLLPGAANSGALPAISFTSGSQALPFGNVTPSSGVMTFSLVANKLSGTNRDIFIRYAGSGGGNNCIDIVAANSWRAVGGSGGTISATATDSVAHAAQSVMNGAPSFLTIDGTDTPGTLTGDTTNAPFGIVGANSTPFYEMEVGVWVAATFNSTQRGNMHTNQSAYWGTP